MKKIAWLPVLVAALLLSAGCARQQGTTVLVLVDTADSSSVQVNSGLLPYLDHFGIVYEVADIHAEKLARPSRDYALVIIGHDMKDLAPAEKYIKALTRHGAGVISFDPDWPHRAGSPADGEGNAAILSFDNTHYIAALHAPGDTVRCFNVFLSAHWHKDDMTPLSMLPVNLL